MDFVNDGEVDSTQQNPSHEYTMVLYGQTYQTNSAETMMKLNQLYYVSEPGVPVTGVSITEGDQTLEIGQIVQPTAVVERDANNKNVS